jgi:hypothetical protein
MRRDVRQNVESGAGGHADTDGNSEFRMLLSSGTSFAQGASMVGQDRFGPKNAFLNIFASSRIKPETANECRDTQALTKDRRGSLLLNPSLIGYLYPPCQAIYRTGVADALSGGLQDLWICLLLDLRTFGSAYFSDLFTKVSAACDERILCLPR